MKACCHSISQFALHVSFPLAMPTRKQLRRHISYGEGWQFKIMLSSIFNHQNGYYSARFSCLRSTPFLHARWPALLRPPWVSRNHSRIETSCQLQPRDQPSAHSVSASRVHKNYSNPMPCAPTSQFETPVTTRQSAIAKPSPPIPARRLTTIPT